MSGDRLLACASVEEVSAEFAANGVSLSDRQAQEIWEQIRNERSGGALSRAERAYARGYRRRLRAARLRERAQALETRLAGGENTGSVNPGRLELHALEIRSWRAQADLLDHQGKRDMEAAEDVFDKYDEDVECLPLYRHLLFRFEEPQKVDQFLQVSQNLEQFLIDAAGVGSESELRELWASRENHRVARAKRLKRTEVRVAELSDKLVSLEREIAEQALKVKRCKANAQLTERHGVEQARLGLLRASAKVAREEMAMLANRVSDLQDELDGLDGPADVAL